MFMAGSFANLTMGGITGRSQNEWSEYSTYPGDAHNWVSAKMMPARSVGVPAVSRLVRIGKQAGPLQIKASAARFV